MEKKEKKRSTLALTRCVLECRLLFPYTSFHRLKKTIFHDPHISCFFYSTVVSEKRCMTFMMSFNVHPKRIVGRAGQVSWGTCSYSCYLKALAGVWGREFVFHFKSLLVTNRVSQCCLFSGGSRCRSVWRAYTSEHDSFYFYARIFLPFRSWNQYF